VFWGSVGVLQAARLHLIPSERFDVGTKSGHDSITGKHVAKVIQDIITMAASSDV
jgi:hypothetical protein